MLAQMKTEYAKQNVILVGRLVSEDILIKHIADLIRVPFVRRMRLSSETVTSA